MRPPVRKKIQRTAKKIRKKSTSKRINHEAREHRIVIDYCLRRGLNAYHGANESGQGKFSDRRQVEIAQRQKKLMGMLPGWPDIIITNKIDGQPFIGGVAIEMKWGKNKPTENQLLRLWELRRNGWAVFVCYTAQEAIETLQDLDFKFETRKKQPGFKWLKEWWKNGGY